MTASAVASLHQTALPTLSACPVMASLAAAYGPCPYTPASDHGPYEAIGRAIVYQQLSGKAAGTILGRVLALAPADRFPAPEPLLALSDDALRGAGLSRNKLAAVRDLARKALAGDLPSAAQAAALDDEALIERLVAVRGVGRWTAQMYLMSGLARPDVWPIDDLGVRAGWGVAYGLETPPTPKALDALGERFRPFRSVAAWHLWQVADRGKPEAAPSAA